MDIKRLIELVTADNEAVDALAELVAIQERQAREQAVYQQGRADAFAAIVDVLEGRVTIGAAQKAE